MLIDVFTFGGTGFFLLVAVFILFELGFLFNASGKEALTTFGIFCAVVFAFVGSTPKIAIGYVLVYLACGLLWVPIYWYLRLRENRRKILSSVSSGLVYLASQDYCIVRDGKAYPKHPSMDDLLANGILWWMAAPIYLANDWIRIGIEAITGFMTKIQKSMAVEVK